MKEKHWHIDEHDSRKTVALDLRCFYRVYMNLLRKAQLAYRGSGDLPQTELAGKGRVALVDVSVDDILSVAGEVLPPASTETSSGGNREISLKVSRLRVRDLIDALPLVPSESVLNTILDAPPQWHRTWHHLVDGMQLVSWRDFPAKMAATLLQAA